MKYIQLIRYITTTVIQKDLRHLILMKQNLRAHENLWQWPALFIVL